MTDRSLRALLVAGLLAALALFAPPALAQDQPTLSPDEQIAPRQMQQAPGTPVAPPKPRPPRTRAVPSATAAPDDDPTVAPAANPAPVAAPAAPKPAAPAGTAARTVACSGAFGKDSNHLKLAQLVGATNIDYGDVSGSGDGSLNASILYGKDPKRRLEVLWQNDAARSDTSQIVITGQSQWRAPKGLKLGLALAALEKLNGKPFKLSGVDQPDGSAVIDWQGGVLAQLPGGCQVGVKLAPDSKASADALKAAAGKEFQSSDAAIRAIKPVVAEIVLGY